MMSRAHLPEIDGLRALAVVAVLLFHAFPSWCPGGYIGVDVFFVISGFVICRTYLRPLVERRTTLVDFYAKRIRRLAPAYAVVLLATTSVAFLALEPRLLRNFGESLLAQPFYAQNVTFWIEGDYFDKAYTKPLLHTWSLAVEEQFYLAFGVLILVARRRGRLLVPVLGVALLLSYLGGHVISASSPKTSFYLLPTRVWEFALGIAAHLVAERIAPRPGATGSRVVFVAASAALASTCFAWDETSRFPGVHALLACGAAATLVVLFDRRPCPFYGAFRLRFVRRLGELSYSLYLWHWPAIVLPTLILRRPLHPFEAAGSLAVSLGLSELTYRLVEEPVRRKRRLRGSRGLFLAWASSSLAVLAIGGLIVATRGALFRYPEPARTLLRAAQDRSPYRCSFRFRVAHPRDEMCPINETSGDGGVLIVGDSHADQVDEMLGRLGAEHGVPTYLAVRSCDLDEFSADGYCSLAVLRRLIEEARTRGVNRVIVTSYWVDEHIRPAPLRASLDLLVDAGMSVYLSEVVPHGPFFDPALHAADMLGWNVGRKPPSAFHRTDHDARTTGQRALFSALAEERPEQVHVLRPANFLCRADGCEFATDGYPNYFDDQHLTPTGAQRLRPMYSPVFGAGPASHH